MRQIKLVLALFFILIQQFVVAQDFSESWIGHFSFLDIKDITQGSTKIFGAAENAIFIYDTQTNENQKLTTINGLSGEAISTMHYVEENMMLLIGFENGLIQAYFETNQEFKTIVDIVEKPTIPSIKKRINHFYVYNGYAYISTNYGISLYDINNLEFGDTYFIGDSGSQIVVNQLVVFDGDIHAATEFGMYYANANNPNLIDYSQWNSFATNVNCIGVQEANNKLFVASNNKMLYEAIGNSLNLLETYASTIQDIRAADNKLIVTTNIEVHIYNTDSFAEIALLEPNEAFQTKFSSGTVTENGEIYIGTREHVSIGKQGYGILKTTYTNTEFFEEIHPECPLSNNFFQISQEANHLWATHGGHSISFGIDGAAVRRSGISHLVDDQWKNITYDTLRAVFPQPWYLSYLSTNPLNPNEVYVGSYFSGLIKRTPESLTLYNQENSTILPFAGPYHLTLASNFDINGDLWVMVGRIHNSINKFSNGAWTSYSLQDVIDPATSNLGFSSIEFGTNNNSIFIGTHNYGLIGFNKDEGNPIVKKLEGEEDNMPSANITSVVLDKQNQIWIGSEKGLRVIYNIDEFFGDTNYQPSEIIILDDGIARELFFQQFITDIKVDGANNKWVATLDTGVYYLSSDGQQTIYHFTKDNSPLPTNDILDIEIDNINGLVYFATDKGLVVFKTETSVPDSDLVEAYVYPNPVRPNFNINDEKIKIKGITGNVNIKITDIEGNLVTEAETRTNTKFSGSNLEIDGGTALWNGKNMSNRTVATGVYLVMISDLDSFETKVLKLMVVR